MVLLLLQTCFCFVMREISKNNQADAIYAFNSIFNIDHPYFMNKC